MTRVALITLNLGKNNTYSQEEINLLAISAGALPIFTFNINHICPNPTTLISHAKLDELFQKISLEKIELVIFNHPLTATQQRNLQNILKIRVIDRISLILDIFSLRAKSFEGKLQVELAQLQYLSSRLVRAWTHLERQKGGIGLRGPGETQLEVDKRLINKRIKHLRQQQMKLIRQRKVQSYARRNNNIINISLVGYTNTGKSTLFNLLTKTKTYVANQLFATLDSLSRRLYLERCAIKDVIISDTVGFICDLPHELIVAFSPTLEEIRQSDLLLHVIDASNIDYLKQIIKVNEVLDKIGVKNIPQIEVWNKSDLIPNLKNIPNTEEYIKCNKLDQILVSSYSKKGINTLRTVITNFINNIYT